MTSHDGMLEMITYLAGHPTMDRVAQFIALDVLADFEPRGALVSVFDSDGSVRAVGSFGLSGDVIRGLQRLSLWDHAPNVDAIRNGTPVVIHDESDLRIQYPGLINHSALVHPTIAWPLRLGRERLGSIQVQFTKLFDEAAIQHAFEAVAPIVALLTSVEAIHSDQSAALAFVKSLVAAGILVMGGAVSARTYWGSVVEVKAVNEILVGDSGKFHGMRSTVTV